MKKIEAAVSKKDSELANTELKGFISDIDKACSKGIIKKNTCARQKSRLNKKVKEMAAQSFFLFPYFVIIIYEVII